MENKDEDIAKGAAEIKEETKAVRSYEDLEDGKEKNVLGVKEENDIVKQKKKRKKSKKRKRKNIFLGWLCGKIIKVFVKRNVLL